MMQGTDTGIGRALRAARLRQGKTLEEASRQTRVRIEHLEALEREAFDGFGGDVYVRGFLRSYARYLGLDADKVLAVYTKAFGRPLPPPTPVERAPGVGSTEALELTERRRPNWVLASAAAIIILAAAGALGILSTRSPVPEQAASNLPPPVSSVAARGVQVDLLAVREVTVAVSLDGEAEETLELGEGEGRSYEAGERIDLRLSQGGVVRVTVNGKRLGRPGERGVPFEQSFFPTSYRERPSETAPSP